MDLMAIRRRLLMMAAAVRRVLHTITSALGLVTFSTALAEPLERCVCELLPVQDLNGYDAPWAPGAGKNLMPTDGWTLNSYVLSDGNIGTDTNNSVDASDFIPVSPSTAYIYSGTNMHKAGSSTSVYVQVAEYNSSKTFISGTRKSVNSGNISFTTNANAAYIRVSRAHDATNTQIEKGSTATAYEPYANICPVEGRTGLTLHRFELPTGYTPVDHITIRNTLTVSQISGLSSFNRDDLVVDCTWLSSLFSGNYKAIYTTTYSAEANNITRLIYQTNASTYLVCNKSKAGGGSTALSGLPGGEWHTIVSEYGGGTVDGTAYTSSTAQGNANTATAIVFGHSGCNLSFRNFSVRSTDASGGTVFLQLIPCTDQNGVAGFYDIIGGHFWTTGASSDASASGTPGKIARVGDTVLQVAFTSTYRRLKDVVFDGSFHYESTVHLIGSDVVTMTISPAATSGMNVFGCYSGTGSSARNFSFFNYRSTTDAYFRYGTVLLRPEFGATATRTVSFGAGGTSGFNIDVSTPETSFTSTDPAWIGMLPNSTSAHYSGKITGPIKVGNRMQFIPVERGDGVIGYFDTLNGVFLAPVGSGTPSTSGYETGSEWEILGGEVDIVSGVLTADWALIASYAGETLPGRWVSDRDAYAPGTTPTVGAQVAYETNKPQIYPVAPTEISAVIGSNTIWHDAGGAITVGYYDTK